MHENEIVGACHCMCSVHCAVFTLECVLLHIKRTLQYLYCHYLAITSLDIFIIIIRIVNKKGIFFSLEK